MEAQEPFWMIYGLGQGAPTMMHRSPELAKDEAKRLARNNPGISFYVLQSVACAIKSDVEFRKIAPGRFGSDDDIPF